MSASELARNLQAPANRITAILNGQRAITGDTARRFVQFFGTSAPNQIKYPIKQSTCVMARIKGTRAGASPSKSREPQKTHSALKLDPP